MLIRRALLSLINFVGLAALFGIGGPAMSIEPPRPSRRRRRAAPAVRRHSRGKLYTPNGRREVARRLRQIEAGQLRVTA